MNERRIWSIDGILGETPKVLGEKLFQYNIIHVSHVKHNSQIYVQYASRSEMAWKLYHSSANLACYACYAVA